MLSAEEKIAIVNYRRQKSHESLNEAKEVIKLGFWSLAGNRLYYAAFHMASALLLDKGITARSHSGVIHLIGAQFVTKGLLEKEYGRLFSRLFEMRQSGDYDDMYDVTEEEILSTCATAFSGGWNSVKLYFILGLPTETDEDVVGIAELVYKILQVWRENGSGKKRGLSINLATAYFVPKPFTPFQWAAQITPEEYLRRVHLLQANLHAKCVDYRYHESDLSRLEAVMARGDRRVGQALLEAHRLGCRLDGWDEYFDYEKWLEAFRRAGLDLDFYTTRGFAADELLPWQTIDVGVTTKFLLHEREKALRSEATPDCRTHCNACGANCLVGGKCDV